MNISGASQAFRALFSTAFILGLGPLPAMGVGGAAAGELVAQVLTLAINAVLFFRQNRKLGLSGRLDLSSLLTFVRISLPTAVKVWSKLIALVVFYRLVELVGTLETCRPYRCIRN